MSIWENLIKAWERQPFSLSTVFLLCLISAENYSLSTLCNVCIDMSIMRGENVGTAAFLLQNVSAYLKQWLSKYVY